MGLLLLALFLFWAARLLLLLAWAARLLLLSGSRRRPSRRQRQPTTSPKRPESLRRGIAPPAPKVVEQQEQKPQTQHQDSLPAAAKPQASKASNCEAKIPLRLPSLNHLRNIREGDRVLNRLRLEAAVSEEKLPIVIGSLRRVSPYVLEELLLTCCSDQGWQIERNFCYSGDGGVDGRVAIAGKEYLIQAKRYKSHINPGHILEFCQAIEREGAAGGFFLHTGKTGPLSKEHLRDVHVILISGQRLVDFILGRRLKIVGVTISVPPD